MKYRIFNMILDQKWIDERFYCAILLCFFTGYNHNLYAQSIKSEKITIPVEVIIDKIRGGLLGQILGNLNGLPHEAIYIEEPGNVETYVPSLPDGARTDDDTDLEWVYIFEMQKNREIFLPYEQIQSLWKERINQRIWCSNRYARYLMDLGLEPPLTGLNSLNPWANFNISGQFLSETFGLLAPAMPPTASKIGLHYTRVGIDAEPAQATQFFTTMIASAFVENDIHQILAAGIQALDLQSIIRKIIEDVTEWHNLHPDDWKKTRQLLKDKYTYENGGIRDWNGVELNSGAIIAALLYGNGSFTETLRLAFNFGWDADCNAATVGTILGVMDGYRNMLANGWKIVDRYKNTTRESMPMNETITSFADRIVELFEMINESHGGEKRIVNNKLVYEIIKEEPRVVEELVPLDQQKAMLRRKFEEEIKHDLVEGNRKDKARAVYIGIMLDNEQYLKEKFPRQWNEACYDLSGYWKVMNNIFFSDFLEMDAIRKKFLAAGINTPIREFNNKEIWDDRVEWKKPEGTN